MWFKNGYAIVWHYFLYRSTSQPPCQHANGFYLTVNSKKSLYKTLIILKINVLVYILQMRFSSVALLSPVSLLFSPFCMNWHPDKLACQILASWVARMWSKRLCGDKWRKKSRVSSQVAVRQVIFTHEQGSRLGFQVLALKPILFVIHTDRMKESHIWRRAAH